MWISFIFAVWIKGIEASTRRRRTNSSRRIGCSASGFGFTPLSPRWITSRSVSSFRFLSMHIKINLYFFSISRTDGDTSPSEPISASTEKELAHEATSGKHKASHSLYLYFNGYVWWLLRTMFIWDLIINFNTQITPKLKGMASPKAERAKSVTGKTIDDGFYVSFACFVLLKWSYLSYFHFQFKRRQELSLIKRILFMSFSSNCPLTLKESVHVLLKLSN